MPMSGYNLMQAIARVNRVFKDKEGGLVVDYVGIASALKQAMKEYTSRDQKKYGNTDIAKVAYPKFQEKLEVCKDLFHGYDYSKFIDGSDLERAKCISAAVNFMVAPSMKETKELYLKEALLCHNALQLCSSIAVESERFEAAFFETVRVMINRLTMVGPGTKKSLKEINDQINEMLKHSIKADGVVSLFNDVNAGFSIFDPKFLEEISKMKEKNLTFETIYDIVALRIITKTEINCYEILGLIHSHYTPLPGRFKDYIAVPK